MLTSEVLYSIFIANNVPELSLLGGLYAANIGMIDLTN